MPQSQSRNLHILARAKYSLRSAKFCDVLDGAHVAVPERSSNYIDEPLPFLQQKLLNVEPEFTRTYRYGGFFFGGGSPIGSIGWHMTGLGDEARRHPHREAVWRNFPLTRGLVKDHRTQCIT